MIKCAFEDFLVSTISYSVIRSSLQQSDFSQTLHPYVENEDGV